MKVFLDSNLIVSAFTTRGLSADVLRLALVEHELVIGEIVIEEVQRVLTKKLRVPREIVAGDIALLRDCYVQPTARAPKESPIQEPVDARILATALAAGADVLVTGDRHFLDVRNRIQGITVTDPRGFWEMQRGDMLSRAQPLRWRRRRSSSSASSPRTHV
ncbi:MAG: putative toxin-antitoxin system toxin component, PIN family [Gemmatimonadota bacterium]